MKLDSIRKNFTVLISLLIVILLAAIFSFFSEKFAASNQAKYSNTIEIQKLFSDIVLHEKLTIHEPDGYSALSYKYQTLKSTCSQCHPSPENNTIAYREQLFEDLFQTHRDWLQLFHTIHNVLDSLTQSTRLTHEYHTEKLKKRASSSTDAIIIEDIGRLLTDMGDIHHSFFELRIVGGKPKNQFLEQNFSSQLEELLFTIEDYAKHSKSKNDTNLVQKLKQSHKAFGKSFADLIKIAYKKDDITKQLFSNRKDVLQLLGDKRVLIQSRNQTISYINKILQYITLIFTVLLIAWIILNGKKIINKTARIASEAENIQNNLDYRIVLDDKMYKEFRVVYVALNAMADKINGQVRELQAAHDDLEVRVDERTAELKTANERLHEEVEEREAAQRQIEIQQVELAKRNFELSAIHEVSSKTTRTIKMPELFDEILDAVLSLEMFETVREGGIYLVEVSHMKLVSILGKLNISGNMEESEEINQCFCGQAVTRNEIIVSQNCFADNGDFTVKADHDLLKEKVVMPLRVKGEVVAVLFFRIPPDSADSYIDKIHLLTVIGNQIGISIENARLYEETKYLALYDPLTRVANRRLMDITLDKLFSATKRYGHPLSVIMADIDHFKKYNDAHGHHAGDKVLAEVVGLIVGEIRNADMAARYGGEEFLIILPETDLSAARILAERIRKTIETNAPVTISQGVATYQDSMEKKEHLVNTADEVLYKAKENGRNRVETTEK